jgi:hypothetical protein
MNVTAVYINTHRYDYRLTCICIASVRYWYPDIKIFLIKDYGMGDFNTSLLQQKWDVKICSTSKKRFGWGYGKLEPLFLENKHSFLILDSDTVLTGPVLETAQPCNDPFLVDDEVQPEKRFNEIYYNLGKTETLAPGFIYPGYSFNSGQWFGSTGYIGREDFAPFIEWTEPPVSKYPAVIFKGDQSVLNFVMHLKEQKNELTVSRKKIMIWPVDKNADFINLKKIKNKERDYPYVIHWAGMKFKKINAYPRADILKFYLSFFHSKFSLMQQVEQKIRFSYLPLQKWLRFKSVKK